MKILNHFFIHFFLFCIGLFGILMNRQNLILVILCIELMLLSINLNFLFFSIYLDDIIGELFSLLILTVAASESAIGLAIIIVFFRTRGSIAINQINLLSR
jgi:NADH-quinone oxidoreductase subunit K